jgi:hypothetical protein
MPNEALPNAVEQSEVRHLRGTSRSPGLLPLGDAVQDENCPGNLRAAGALTGMELCGILAANEMYR